MYDLAFVNGAVVSEDGEAALDVFVTGGKISALAARGAQLRAHEIVDVSGLHVLPGVIDAHAHFRTWSQHSDDLGQLATSAASGGVTTVLPFVMGMNAEGTDLLSRVEACIAEGTESSPIDFAFHAAIADEPETLQQIERVMDLGVTSFKMFMINRARRMMVNDEFLYQAMSTIAKQGGLAMVHGELEDICNALALSDQVTTSTDAHERFSRSRPTWVEAEATRRAIEIAAATECPLYVVHVTCEAALDVIREARSKGQIVYAETCPHYLGLTLDDQRRLGGLVKVAPPLRSVSDNRALTAAVLSGDIDVVSSDHAPYTRANKTVADMPFEQVPVGMPGTETLLPVTWSLLKNEGAPLSMVHRVLTANPSRIFGLQSKGQLAVGFDADITLVNLQGSTTIDGSSQHSSAGYSAYDGWDVPLEIAGSYQRGIEVLSGNGTLAQTRGSLVCSSRQPAMKGARR